ILLFGHRARLEAPHLARRHGVTGDSLAAASSERVSKVTGSRRRVGNASTPAGGAVTTSTGLTRGPARRARPSTRKNSEIETVIQSMGRRMGTLLRFRHPNATPAAVCRVP